MNTQRECILEIEYSSTKSSVVKQQYEVLMWENGAQ